MKTPLTSGQITALRGLFFAVAVVAVVAWAFFVVGCQTAQWRVFQKKVDAKMAETPAAQSEGQKRAAAYIVKRTEAPVPDPAVAVQDVHQVAVGLSASLGEPAKPVTLEDKDAVIASLRKGLQAKEAQLDAWKKFARTYAGKPLEDTGINLAGPAGLLAFAGVIAACIFIPGFGYVLLRLVPVLWGMVRRMAVGIESFAKDMPAEGEKLKQAYLARKMNEVDKRIVKGRKKAIRPEEIISAVLPANP